MKKNGKTLLCLVFSLIFIFFLASCNIVDDGKLLVRGEDTHYYILENGEKVGEEPHEYSTFVRVALLPTCTEEGIEIYKCSCQKTTEVVIPALGHDVAEEVLHDEKEHWNECHCGEKFNVTSHEYKIAGEVLEESTCTKTGTQVYLCSCGASTVVELALKDHVYTDKYYTDETNHWFECVCGDKSEINAHSYNIAGEVTLEPTCLNTGKQMFACVCGLEEEQVIPALGHIDENGDILCDNEGCKTKVLPKANSVISLFTANQIGKLVSSSNQYYVEGVVSQTLDQSNGIFYLQDEAGDEFYFRLPKDSNGNLHSKWDQKIVLGDTVKLYGKINKFTSSSGSIPSMQGALVVELIHEHEFSEATCTTLSECRCQLTQGELLPHESLDGDIYCDKCGKNVNLKDFFTKINTLDNDPNSGVLDAKTKRTWTYDIFTLEIAKGTASDIYVTKDNYMKIKKNNTFSLVANGDVQFSELVITSTSTTYAKAIVQSLKGIAGIKVETVDDINVVITFEEPAKELAFKFAASSRIASIKVSY